MKIPQLNYKHTASIPNLETCFIENQTKIEAWFREQWHQTPPLLMCSVDLRHSGYKIAPVDTNLFPAGFNNLNRNFLPLQIQAAQNTIDAIYPSCKQVLLIAESHTRNLFYYHNLAYLQEILIKAGYETRIGTFLESIVKPRAIKLDDDKHITIAPITRRGKQLYVGDFRPCAIVLNHDLLEGIPDLLKDIEQPISPALALSWSSRLKTTHFSHYQQLCEHFAKIINIDPWLIQPLFRQCDQVDFIEREGETCLVNQSKKLFDKINQHYQQYDIKEEPFVVIKADAGTYGMGVMMIKNSDEIQKLNRKQRTRMSTTKGNKKIDKVIIQEGIYTFETSENAVAEPVIYIFGSHVIGGFYRIHKERGQDENLNAPGMFFEPLNFSKACNNPEKDTYTNRLYTYGVIARLAALAAAHELEALQHDD